MISPDFPLFGFKGRNQLLDYNMAQFHKHAMSELSSHPQEAGAKACCNAIEAIALLHNK